MIKAVIFDLDGVLVETEPQTFEFFKNYLKDFGITLKKEDLHKKIGRKSIDFFHDILSPEELKRVDIQKLIDHKRDKFNENLSQFVNKIPFAEEVVPLLKKKGLKLALASQNENVMINKILDWLKLTSSFDVVLSLQDIKNKKPHPEIYLKAMQRLGVEPHSSMVVEDSETGITAAKASGAYVIALRHLYTPPNHLTLADKIIDELEKLKDLF